MNLPEFFTPQVIWFIAGVALLLLELALPGLIVMFFGAGAWITSLSIIIFHPNINVQLFIFIASSVLTLLVFRKYLQKRFFSENRENANTLEDEFIGKVAVAEAGLKSGQPGKVSFKGTTWNAISDTDIAEGGQVVIKDKESITLLVTIKQQ
ncbi:MAG: NfeD family protein [Bacteroidales bacterium]|nr:NfeD family protein [Bacteroidales bacterium]